MKRIPTASIKWFRLAEICEDVLKRDLGEKITVDLHASTSVPDNVRAEVKRTADHVDILLNMGWAKILEEVVESIAHELAHVALGEGDAVDHPDNPAWNEAKMKQFERKAKELHKAIVKAYRKENS